jgi:predicted enzyme related to lactoylglutathione lyase
MKEKNSINEFCWNELISEGTSKSKEFYSNLLGWTSMDCECSCTNGVKYTIFKNNNKDIAGLMAKPKDCTCPHQSFWISYIGVLNIKESVAKAVSLGAKILVEPRDIGIGSIAIITDPLGATVGLFEKKNSVECCDCCG